MGRYDDEETSSAMRQKDLVLASNEYVFIQSNTSGAIKTYTGPIMVTISQQESMVIFNSKTKKFESTGDFNRARQLFTSAPEGWYVVLKNPAPDNVHPESNKGVIPPALNIGKKINVAGPVSFSLFPGQMTKVVQGHRLRSNQYLLARVYDADAASKSIATIVNADGQEIKQTEKYFVGQLLIIKGTEVSFYMPPTGIEVIPVGGVGDTYIRDAITLERLEYVILKDEDGEKRYVHGPAVVFPKPTETFVESPKGGNIFRALELSPISGIYVKVIADYKDEDGTEHKTGEELFITGNEQMIYYPRPEHAMIQYDGKYMHHAIAIPEGEGRYILDRLKGTVKTVVGPVMYLPDPRTEVVVKRKLTDKECELFYPGNAEALAYNRGLSEQATEKLARRGGADATTAAINNAYSTSNALDSLAIFEATANISRGVSYTKPRTITLDTKYDGVVSIDVWSNYAICVVSKTGKREVVVGPQTRILDYDETLESVNTVDGKTAFLQLTNNSFTTTVGAVTSDLVSVTMDLKYRVDFGETTEKWFSTYDYMNTINAKISNTLKQKLSTISILDLYTQYNDIVRTTVLDKSNAYFAENDATITDVEIAHIKFSEAIQNVILSNQKELVTNSFKLKAAEAQKDVIKQINENQKYEQELAAELTKARIDADNEVALARLAREKKEADAKRENEKAAAQADADIQVLYDQVKKAELARIQAERDAQIAYENEKAIIEQTKQDAYADNMEKIIKAIGPDLVAALTSKSNAELLAAGMKNMSPWALANNEEVSTTVDRILRGTTLEGLMTNITKGEE